MNMSSTIGRMMILFFLLIPFMFACSNSGDHPISAEILTREFKKDPQSAYKKYEGQWLIVFGELKGIANDQGSPASIVLKGVDGYGGIICSLEKTSIQAEAPLSKLKSGQRVLVKGYVSPLPQYLLAVYLDKCQVVQEIKDKA